MRRDQAAKKAKNVKETIDSWAKTKSFIASINERMAKHHREKQKEQRNTRLSLEDVVPADRHIAQNFECLVCMHIIGAEAAV